MKKNDDGVCGGKLKFNIINCEIFKSMIVFSLIKNDIIRVDLKRYNKINRFNQEFQS